LLKKFKKINLKNSFTYILPGIYWFISDKSIDNNLNELYNWTLYNNRFDKKLLNYLNHFWLLNIDDKHINYKINKVKNIYWHQHLLYFSITNSCNLKCDFCVASANYWKIKKDILTTKEIENILDSIDEFVLKNKKIKYTVAITWWEPFLRNDTIKIIEYCSNKHFNINVATNGTLLNDTIIEKISKINNISISISIDSYLSSEHDKYRWNFVFNRAVKNIEKLVKLNVPVFINSFTHNWNINTINKRIDFFSWLWVKWVNFMNSFRRWRDKKSNFTHVDEWLLFSIFYNIIKNNKKYYNLLKNESKFTNTLSKIKFWWKVVHTWTWINEPFFINEKWDFFVSPALSISDKYKIWNLKNKSFWDMIESSDILQKIRNLKLNKTCSNCEYKYICWWENYWENLSVNDNVNSPHYFCTDIKKSYIEIFNILSNDNNICNDKLNDIKF